MRKASQLLSIRDFNIVVLIFLPNVLGQWSTVYNIKSKIPRNEFEKKSQK